MHIYVISILKGFPYTSFTCVHVACVHLQLHSTCIPNPQGNPCCWLTIPAHAGAKTCPAPAAGDNVETQPIDIMAHKDCGESPVPSASPPQPAKLRRKIYQGISPPSALVALPASESPGTGAPSTDLVASEANCCTSRTFHHTRVCMYMSFGIKSRIHALCSTSSWVSPSKTFSLCKCYNLFQI